MERDVEAALGAGAEGVVFGALQGDGRVDDAACRRLRAAARDRQVVFHRAFDATPDPFQALDELIALGFTRVLTSGQRPSALEAPPPWDAWSNRRGTHRDSPRRRNSRPQRPGDRAPHRLPSGPPDGLRRLERSLDGGAARPRLPLGPSPARSVRARRIRPRSARWRVPCGRRLRRPQVFRAEPRSESQPAPYACEARRKGTEGMNRRQAATLLLAPDRWDGEHVHGEGAAEAPEGRSASLPQRRTV